MSNLHKLIQSIALIITITIFAISATTATRIETSHTFTRGITHISIEDPDYFEDRFRHLSLNILELDPTQAGIHIAAPNHSARGLEMLVDQAYRLREQGHNIIGGINGDMFAMHGFGVAEGQPSCLTVVNGEIVTMHHNFGESRALPVFASDNDGEIFFGHLILDLTAEVYRNGNRFRSLNLSHFNRNYGFSQQDIVMFTPRFSDDGNIEILTPDVDNYLGVRYLEQWEFAVVELENGSDKIVAGQEFRGTLVEAIDDIDNARVPDGAIVIAAHDLMERRRLEIGDEIKFELNIYKTPENVGDGLGEPMNHLTEIIGAYNWLIRDGEVQTEDDWAQVLPVDWIITSTPARTGIGIREDGTILAVTVDQSFDVDSGMTMVEFAQLFYELGAVQALNFDGGSSTEMIAINQNREFVTLNTPTGLDPRPISTSVLFSSNSGNVRGVGHSTTDKIILWALFSSLTILAASSILLGIIKLKKRIKS